MDLIVPTIRPEGGRAKIKADDFVVINGALFTVYRIELEPKKRVTLQPASEAQVHEFWQRKDSAEIAAPKLEATEKPKDAEKDSGSTETVPAEIEAPAEPKKRGRFQRSASPAMPGDDVAEDAT